jgi:hypothetical protein
MQPSAVLDRIQSVDFDESRLTLRGRAVQFKTKGSVYVGDLEQEDVIDLIKLLELTNVDTYLVRRGRLVLDEINPTPQACALSFESVLERGDSPCTVCLAPAFLHRSERDS